MRRRQKLRLCGAVAVCITLAPLTAIGQNMTKPINPLGQNRILVACQMTASGAIDNITPAMDWDGFAERDILFLSRQKNALHVLHDGEANIRLTNAAKSRILILSLCQAGNEFVLIGKDGGVKRRWSDYVTTQDLYQTIDAMPMRRYEMRQKDGNN